MRARDWEEREVESESRFELVVLSVLPIVLILVLRLSSVFWNPVTESVRDERVD